MKLKQLLSPLTRRTQRQLISSATRATPMVSSGAMMEPLENRQLMSAGLSVSIEAVVNGKLATTASVNSVGQTLNLVVVATVTGTTAGANQGIDSLCGSIIGTQTDGNYSVGGDLENATPLQEFQANGSLEAANVDLNGDGYLDCGSNNNSDIAGFFNARAGGIVNNGYMVSGDSNIFILGTLTYTVDTLNYGQATDVSFRLRDGIPAGAYDAVWEQDGIGYNDGPSSGTVSIASPLVITDSALTPPPDGSIAGNVTSSSFGSSANLSGVTMFLNTTGSSSFASGDATAITSSSGQYSFTGLHSGTYYVGEELPSGYTLTTPSSQPIKVVLSASQNASGQDFIDAATGAISGTVNQLNSGTSSALSGIAVTLSNGGKQETTTTSSNGSYSFTSLAAGTYDVSSAVPSGDTQTTPASSPIVVSLSAGQSATGQNFVDSVNSISPGSISGTVTQNVNGVSSDEPSVLLYLDLNDTGSLASGDPTAVTSATGTYSFTGLQPATYLLREVVPSGYKQTSPANTPTLLTLSSGQSITGQDFVNTATSVTSSGSISGTVSKIVSGATSADSGVVVYLDSNDNGSLNTGEPSTTTSSTGAYSFTGLAAGTYYLREVVPTNYTQTSPGSSPTTIKLSSGQTVSGQNFVDTASTVSYIPASIAGTVYNDKNSNGKLDSGEPGIAGVEMFIDLNLDGTIDSGDPTATTSSTGAYSFTGLAPGTYRVREVVPAGDKLTNPAVGYFGVTVQSNWQITGENWGNTVATTATGSISGTVSKVVIGSTSADSGVTVYLDQNNDGVLDSGDVSTVTSLTGSYSFTGLPAGTYHVRQMVPGGYSQTSPTSSPTTLTLSAGQSVTGENFTDTAASTTNTGAISGEVFSDANSNGKLDSGELGIPGVTVYLDINKDGKYDSGDIATTTSSTGTYSFTGLAAGTYSVRETLISGDTFTSPSSGALSVTVASGAKITGENFGNTGPLSLAGTVFDDINGDGIMNGSDAGMSGWVVYCDLNHNGVFVASDNNKTTLSNGSFDFVSLKAGTYTIRVVAKSGYALTSPASGYYTVTLAPGLPVTGINFAEHPTSAGTASGIGSTGTTGSTSSAVTLSGTVFNDLAGTGVQTANDPGLAGWVVYCDLNDSGTFVASDNNKTTLSNGSFEFVSLKAGTYTVRVVPQAGYTQTLPDDGFYTVTLAPGDPVSISFGEH